MEFKKTLRSILPACIYVRWRFKDMNYVFFMQVANILSYYQYLACSVHLHL